MTKSGAIDRLIAIRASYICRLKDDRTEEIVEKRIEALNMAIEALSDRPTGEWLDRKSGWACTTCNKWNNEMSNYCPNCGAKMERSE